MTNAASTQVTGRPKTKSSATTAASPIASRRSVLMRRGGAVARVSSLSPSRRSSASSSIRPVHRQMLAFDDARHLLGLGRLLEQTERDVRLERLAAGRRVQRLIELGQFGGAVGRLGIEIEIGPHDAVDQEPERPLVDAAERGAQRRLAVGVRPEHQGEMRADQVGLARMVLRAQAAQGGVVGLARTGQATT